MIRANILLVDDREDGLTALEAVLFSPEYNLVKAHSGFEALDLLPQNDFACILLDVQMPGIDGFETAYRIKKDERFRDIPIIFVTAINKDDEYIYKGYDRGAVDYIFKPFDAHILRSKVSVFVELFQKTRKLEEQAELVREAERRERYLRLAELEVKSLKRYQSLADSIPHAVWRSRSDGTMDYFNKVWSQLTGLSEEQSTGLGWQAAIHPEDLQILLKLWIKAMAEGLGFELECRVKTIVGDWRWHSVRVVPEFGMKSEVIAWLGTCTDIHDRKAALDNVIEARREAEMANQAKTQFLANMSHEIRTPLNAILGFAELMMSPRQTTTDHQSSLVTIRRNGQQLLKIIDEILDISKVESGRLELEMIEVELDQLFVELNQLLQISAREKKLPLNLEFTTPIPSRIVTDPTRYRQILFNIIGNAIKFTDSGQVDVEVSWVTPKTEPKLVVNGERGRLRCKVTDTGVGIEAANATRLFQPFMQADSSTTRKFGGTGLGLALSRRLANALGGDVILDPEHRECGTCFVIEIDVPFVKESGFVSKPNRAAGPVEKTEAKSDEAPLRNVRVLVVDDALDNRTLVSRFLSGAGANVECANDGYEGIQKALSSEYDIILMDIQMPKLDGYAATSQLRDKGYDGPIIALSAHALREERENSIRVGCDDHLTKPIDKKTLIGHVAKFAGRETHNSAGV